MGGFLGVLGSIVVGGAVATATTLGVISSQTGPAEQSPADVSSEIVVDYGTASN
ncbi:hypothetical protein [Nocardioides bigeumensis]|uniref:DUF2613 family protein n=1 Tax=Nocardioides bigeumensis TaxID=433657 RepID=A0ABP5JGD8_9ACTN